MKNIVIILTFLFLTSLSLSTSPDAQASNSVAAMVVAARGSVVAISPDGTSRELKTKSDVYTQDTIDTGKTGKIQLMFKDNTLISLGRKTEMKIAEYNWNNESKEGNLKTEVKEGTFRIMGGSLAKHAPQNFKTVTPSATIGIRGSMYTGSILAGRLSVVFQGGKGIEITNPQGAVVITKPGYGTSVAAPNARPAKPTKFTAKDIENLNSSLVNGDPDQQEEPGDNEEAGGQDDQQDQKDENAAADNDEEAANEQDDGASADNQPAADEDESSAANEPDQTAPAEDGGDDPGNQPPPGEDPQQQPPAEEPYADPEPEPAPGPEPTPGPEPAPGPEPVAGPEPVPSPEPIAPTIPIPEPPPTDPVDPDQEFIDAAIAAKDKAIAAAVNAGNAKTNTLNATTLANKLSGQQTASNHAIAAQLAANEAASAAANTSDQTAQTAKTEAQTAANLAFQHYQSAVNEYNFASTKTTDAQNAYNTATIKKTAVQNSFQNAISATDLASRASATQAASLAAAAAQTAANNALIAANATNATDAANYASLAATASTTAGQKYTELTTNTKNISGKFLSIAVDTVDSSGTNDKFWLGQVDGNTIYGHPLAKSSDSGAPFADGSYFPFGFTNALYSPTPVYDGWEFDPKLFHVHIHNKDFYFNGEVMYSPFDQFYSYTLPDIDFTDGIDYHFGMEGFAGVESTSLPTDGSDSYFGGFISAVTSQTSSNIELRNGFMIAETNWKNGKIFGFLESMDNGQPKNPTYFYGDLSGTSVTNVKIVGSGSNQDNTQFFASTGGANFAQFYGSVNQGFGFTASGTNYEMANQANPLSNWEAVGSAFKFIDHNPVINSPVDPANWQGFFTGMADDYGLDKELIMNNDSSLFNLAINRAAGTISGSMSSSGTTGDLIITNMVIGGSYGSAYILDDMFIAELGCGSDCIEKYLDTSSPKTYGNFLTTAKPGDWDWAIDANDNPVLENIEDPAKKIVIFAADGSRLTQIKDENNALLYDEHLDPNHTNPILYLPEEQFAEYATWGYWETAYTMNGEYRFAMPGSLWVAGQLTPVADITNLTNNSVVGRYIGGAHGLKIDLNVTYPNPPVITHLKNGVTDLTIDFANLTAASSMQGTISFHDNPSPEKIFTIQSVAGDVSNTGFAVDLNNGQNGPILSGSVNGNFYGDNAKSIGGNFRADYSTEKYIGVFGGDRQP